MNTTEELKECLALQDEIDAKTLALRKRYKAVIEDQREQGNASNVAVMIDGCIYTLQRFDRDEEMYRDAMATARKVGGFYLYRLVKTAKMA
jgi:hypothetical protein